MPAPTRTGRHWAPSAAGGGTVLQALLALPVAREGVVDTPGEPTVEFRFPAQPLEFLPAAADPERVGSVVMARSCGDATMTETLRIDLAVSCARYNQTNRLQLPVIDGVVRNDAGQVGDRLYVVGWAGRGASGTIGMNRTDSHRIAAPGAAGACGRWRQARRRSLAARARAGLGGLPGLETHRHARNRAGPRGTLPSSSCDASPN